MKTLKTIIAVLICLLMATNLLSQNKISISAKAGLNLSNTKTFIDTTWNTKSTTGANVGINVTFPIKSLFLQTGISFSQKGFNYETTETNWNGETIKSTILMKTDYIELPISLGKKFSINDNLGISVLLGGYLGSALSGDITQSFEYSGQIEKINESMRWGEDRDFIRLDYGYNFGLEFSYKMISLGVQKTNGICNFMTDDGELYNRTLTFYTSYKF